MHGRRVVVTGVGGIGAAVARHATAAGAQVHLVDVAEERLRLLAAEIDCQYTVADLRTRSEADRAFTAAANALNGGSGRSGVDSLVAVAGGSGRRFGDGPVHTLDESAIEQTLGLNLTPAALALGAFVRHRDPSTVCHAILTGSVLARHPNRLFATHGYAAAKAAIEGLALASASFYADQRVCVNVVAPGLTRTPMSARAQVDPETIDFARDRQPLGDEDGFVDPGSVAAVCCAVLDNPAVTGQVIAVDAGWSVR